MRRFGEGPFGINAVKPMTVTYRHSLTLAASALALIGGPAAFAAATPAAPSAADPQAATPVAPGGVVTADGQATAASPQMMTGDGRAGIDVNGDGIDDDTGEILVVATPIRGVVKADQPPIVTLDEEEIAAYGVNSISDLLSVLAPQTGSGRGRGGSGGPVILLNGMRISSFREMRGLPPEAIRRVEVLPEEVALKYGYRPDQRVVNFILKDNFKSYGSETEVGLPTNGSFATVSEEATAVRIANKARINVTGTLSTQSAITEAERGIQQTPTAAPTVAGDPSAADYRTLQGKADSAALNATWSKPIGVGTGLTLNLLAQRDFSRSLNGLSTITLTDPAGNSATRTTATPEPLTTRVYTTTISAGAGLNAGVGAWQLSVTADGSHVETTTRIDNRADLGGLQALVTAGSLGVTDPLPGSAIIAVSPDEARSRTDSLTSLATLSGQPFRLPAGPSSLTVKTGFAYSGINSTDSRTMTGSTRLRRSDAQAGFSLDMPITSRRDNFGGAIGDLSLNLNAEAHTLSDIGGLYDYGAGLTWRPTEKLSLTGTFIGTEVAPTLSQLAAPTTVTQNVAVYDFTKGQTVLATVISGGNPTLAKERDRDIKLAANWTLPFLTNSTFVLEYFRNLSFNAATSFPLLTADVEAAFPGRVTRDQNGNILSIDQSPVMFARQEKQSLRYGINLSGSFGTPDPTMQRGGRFPGMAMMRGAGGPPPGGPGGPPPGGPSSGGMGAVGAGGPPPGAGGPPPGGMGGGRGGFDGRGRWNLSLTHTIILASRVQLTPGGQIYDQLGGDALTTGGVARHSIQLEGGGFYRGFGLRITGTYTGGARADSGQTSLDFHPIATLDARVFADLGRKPALVKAVPFLKNSRVSLAVSNLFDGTQRVTDQNGQIPLRYQVGYLNPTGRVFKLEFRKQF